MKLELRRQCHDHGRSATNGRFSRSALKRPGKEDIRRAQGRRGTTAAKWVGPHYGSQRNIVQYHEDNENSY